MRADLCTNSVRAPRLVPRSDAWRPQEVRRQEADLTEVCESPDSESWWPIALAEVRSPPPKSDPAPTAPSSSSCGTEESAGRGGSRNTWGQHWVGRGWHPSSPLHVGRGDVTHTRSSPRSGRLPGEGPLAPWLPLLELPPACSAACGGSSGLGQRAGADTPCTRISDRSLGLVINQSRTLPPSEALPIAFTREVTLS